MLKAGLQKTSLVDYPGIVAAVIFLPYCNFRCPWCHNGSLVEPSEADEAALLPISTINDFLKKRQAVLEGLVITGGEPTVTRELPDLIRHYKSIGFKVKLDTNGGRSAVLEGLFSNPDTRPDYIALDLKLSPERYPELGGSQKEMQHSANLINSSGIAHEYRTIVLPGKHQTEADIRELAALADDCSPWVFSPFKPGSCLDPAWNAYPQPEVNKVEQLAELARSLGKTVQIRGLKK